MPTPSTLASTSDRFNSLHVAAKKRQSSTYLYSATECGAPLATSSPVPASTARLVTRPSSRTDATQSSAVPWSRSAKTQSSVRSAATRKRPQAQSAETSGAVSRSQSDQVRAVRVSVLARAGLHAAALPPALVDAAMCLAAAGCMSAAKIACASGFAPVSSRLSTYRAADSPVGASSRASTVAATMNVGARQPVWAAVRTPKPGQAASDQALAYLQMWHKRLQLSCAPQASAVREHTCNAEPMFVNNS
jgi:hypothetical protein